MREITNECCDCGLPCLGSACPNSHVEHFICDGCGEEEQLYYFEGEELCIECIKERLEKVNEY